MQRYKILVIGSGPAGEGAAMNLRDFIDTTFNYRTMAEAYRVAAHHGRKRLA